ncbi:MAG TPA: cytochrome c oxidase subunit 3, partial [Actinomycetota bacterium]
MTAVGLTRDERVVRQTSGPVLGMVVFVASEAMFFATFFGAYFTIYSVNPVWPPAGFPHLKPELATVLTVLLVTSSVTL